MTAKFYGIGVGPGEPELLTVKAVNILKTADIIVTPLSKTGRNSIALEIAKKFINENTKILEMEFPMVDISKNQKFLQEKWKSNAEIVKKYLDEEKNVVFLTLGDPMVYSTYSYILDIFRENGISCETISGIPSFIDIAAKLNIPLMQGEESLAVLSLTQTEEEVKNILDANKNIVIMKVSSNQKFLKEELIKRNLEKNFVLVSNIGRADERISNDIEILDEKLPYLSTMIIKKEFEFK